MVLVRQPDATYTAEIFADAFSEGYQITQITPVALVSVISAAHGGALVPMVGLALGKAQIHTSSGGTNRIWPLHVVCGARCTRS